MFECDPSCNYLSDNMVNAFQKISGEIRDEIGLVASSNLKPLPKHLAFLLHDQISFFDCVVEMASMESLRYQRQLAGVGIRINEETISESLLLSNASVLRRDLLNLLD